MKIFRRFLHILIAIVALAIAFVLSLDFYDKALHKKHNQQVLARSEENVGLVEEKERTLVEMIENASDVELDQYIEDVMQTVEEFEIQAEYEFESGKHLMDKIRNGVERQKNQEKQPKSQEFQTEEIATSDSSDRQSETVDVGEVDLDSEESYLGELELEEMDSKMDLGSSIDENETKESDDDKQEVAEASDKKLNEVEQTEDESVNLNSQNTTQDTSGDSALSDEELPNESVSSEGEVNKEDSNEDEKSSVDEDANEDEKSNIATDANEALAEETESEEIYREPDFFWGGYIPDDIVTLAEQREITTAYLHTQEIHDADLAYLAECELDFYENPLKITCLGDSITAAANLDSMENYRQYAYPHILGEALGDVEVTNLGIGGSSIGRYWADAFVDRYKEIPEDSDVIIIMGGTNDGFCASAEEFGSLESRKEHTFIGDLDELMRGVRENYPEAMVVFATPLPNVLHDQLRAQREYLLSQQNFAYAIMELAKEYDFYMVDLYDLNFLDTHDPDVIRNYMPDGVHCNPEGYEILGDHFAAEIAKLLEENLPEKEEGHIDINLIDEMERTDEEEVSVVNQITIPEKESVDVDIDIKISIGEDEDTLSDKKKTSNPVLNNKEAEDENLSDKDSGAKRLNDKDSDDEKLNNKDSNNIDSDVEEKETLETKEKEAEDKESEGDEEAKPEEQQITWFEFFKMRHERALLEAETESKQPDIIQDENDEKLPTVENKGRLKIFEKMNKNKSNH